MIPEWLDQYMSMAALNITWSDVVEILILAFIIYHVMIWIKSTRAWSLMKGSAVLLALLILAYVFHMNTILWIAKNFFSLGIMAVIVVFQPELRRALEQLGENNLLTSIVPFDNSRFPSAKVRSGCHWTPRTGFFSCSRTSMTQSGAV